MFAAERQRKIREMLLEYKEVSLNTLCSCLSTSISTIRRDLDKLEEENFLKRTHGGAILVESPITSALEPSVIQDDSLSNDICQIARLAVKTLCNGDMVFLGSGKICHYMSSLMHDCFTGCVFTNSVDIALTLSNSANIQVFLLGGLLTSTNGSTSTEEAVFPSGVDNIVVNKAYLEVSGITLQHGYFVETVSQQQLYKKLSANTSETFVLLDPNIVNKISMAKLDHHFSFSKNVITSSTLPDTYKQVFNENKVKLFTSFSVL